MRDMSDKFKEKWKKANGLFTVIITDEGQNACKVRALSGAYDAKMESAEQTDLIQQIVRDHNACLGLARPDLIESLLDRILILKVIITNDQ